jgi:FkbM family methyltransferase
MKFYGQFDPPVDQFLYERYFKGRAAPGLCIECGAYDGVGESSCKFFEETLHWKAVNVEAYPFAFERLERNRPASVNVRGALSDRKGTATFTAAIHPRLGPDFGNGSLAHLPAHRAELDGMGCTYRTFQVETFTFPDLLARAGVDRPDLFVLDVEGHELAVLAGMGEVPRPSLPKILCVEFGNLGLEAVRAATEPLGYEFDTTSHVNAFFFRSDFPDMSKALFRKGMPDFAWEAAEIIGALATLWDEHQALRKAYDDLQARAGRD